MFGVLGFWGKMTLKHAPDLAHQIEEPWASGRD